jgi:hypothetical protein
MIELRSDYSVLPTNMQTLSSIWQYLERIMLDLLCEWRFRLAILRVCSSILENARGKKPDTNNLN